MNDAAKSVPAGLLDRLRAALGPKGFIDETRAMAPHLKDWRGLYSGTSPAVLFPASTEEIAKAVAACAEAGVGVVPQGGNTGLVGAGVPRHASGEIVVNLKRMNRVRLIDAADYTMVAEAGCVLADLQKAAESADRLFPLSLGAEGSCQIGGNLSTNAGGINVLRYGNARELVLGLEVVLPDGRVWNGLRRLRKDNTGYALKHVFIGAEGTLGIITAAALRLFPRPRETATAFAALRDLDAAVELLAILRAGSGDAVSSFELVPRMAIDLCLRHLPGIADPLKDRHAWCALIEFTGTVADGRTAAALEASLAAALDRGVIVDATIAQSQDQAKKIWRIREELPEAQVRAGANIKHDVSVAVSQVPEFIRRADAALKSLVPGAETLAFGHVGDGNVHYNLCPPPGADLAAFIAKTEAVGKIVYGIAAEMDGSFSAEHGIGQLRRQALLQYRSPLEVELMRSLKRALDPKGLMNPGKVL
ncbi:MAG: FAD-binding oxidoreductase [Rhodospirillales bacterium]